MTHNLHIIANIYAPLAKHYNFTNRFVLSPQLPQYLGRSLARYCPGDAFIVSETYTSRITMIKINSNLPGEFRMDSMHACM